MGRVSKVRRLPPELREQLHMMLDAGHSLEAIVQHLKSLGADVSRSGLGRYKQQVDKVAQRLRESRNMAEGAGGHGEKRRSSDSDADDADKRLSFAPP